MEWLLGEETVWIQRIKSGDADGFGQLYERHHRKLFALCYRFTGNPADAEEQLQEVFIRDFQRLLKLILKEKL